MEIASHGVQNLSIVKLGEGESNEGLLKFLQYQLRLPYTHEELFFPTLGGARNRRVGLSIFPRLSLLSMAAIGHAAACLPLSMAARGVPRSFVG